MILEAHEIRETQNYKNLSSVANVQGLKQNIAEESVSNTERFPVKIWKKVYII